MESKLEGSLRYQKIVRDGMSRTHRQAIDWVPPGSAVLEIGCSAGYLGSILVSEKACRVTGIELDADAAAAARLVGLQVIEGSLDEPLFRASVTGPFDAVLATDVIEHLREPVQALRMIRRVLRPGGRVVLSTPNIASWRVRKRLFFRGDWRYEESGVMDRTHVHFFTWETLNELLRSEGFRVIDVLHEWDEVPLVDDSPVLRWLFGPIRPRMGRALTSRLPNLCAGHMALLLEVPATRLLDCGALPEA